MAQASDGVTIEHISNSRAMGAGASATPDPKEVSDVMFVDVCRWVPCLSPEKNPQVADSLQTTCMKVGAGFWVGDGSIRKDEDGTDML